MSAGLWFSAAALGLASLVWGRVAWRLRRHLEEMPEPPEPGGEPEGGWPAVTVIVPARNEEKHLARALDSLLCADYPKLEIIAVNDHSTDRTGEILDEASRSDARLRVLHDPKLPPGWMGKNNAIWQAARLARGEWLLLTDADIVHHPRALRRALGEALRERLDIAAMLPRVEAVGPAERLIFPPLTTLAFALFSPKRARRAGRRQVLGVGAFNLVRREAYFRVGGHAAFPGEVLEDIALARRLRDAGHGYGLLDGTNLLNVRMYTGLGEIFRGFRKNMFAGMHRNVAFALLGALGFLFLLSLPFAAGVASLLTAAIVADSVTRLGWISLGVGHGMLYVAASVFLGMRAGKRLVETPRRPAWGHPLAGMVLAAIMAASVYEGVVHRRVVWRGRELKTKV